MSDLNGPDVTLSDLFSPTLQKKMGMGGGPFLPFTPTSAGAGFNLFSPHFSPHLNFLLNTPAVKESLQFAFPIPSGSQYYHASQSPKSPDTSVKEAPKSLSPSVPHTSTTSNDEYEYDSDCSMTDSAYAEEKEDELSRAILRQKMEAEHKPARGRQRKTQLLKMTPAERELEREILMEKSRQSARDCRKRKKLSIENLRAIVAEHEKRAAQDKDTIHNLRVQLQQMKKLVAAKAKA